MSIEWSTTAPELASGCDWGSWLGTSSTVVKSAGCFYINVRFGQAKNKKIAVDVKVYIAGGDYVPTTVSYTITVAGNKSSSYSHTASSYSYSGPHRYALLDGISEGETIKCTMSALSTSVSKSGSAPKPIGGVSLSIKVDGSWTSADAVYVKADGNWIEADSLLVKVDGAWTEAV